MTNFLIRLFIKNYEETSSPQVRESYGRLSGIVGIVTNMLLAISKVVIGVVFSSIAILADGINNLSDAGSSIVALIGFKLAGIPEDASHPYGHARYEYIAGLIISIIIIFLGGQLLMESVSKIINPNPLHFSRISVYVLFLAIVLKIWQMFFYRTLGEKIKSSTIKALSKDSRNDAISTIAVLASILIGKATNIQLDGIIGAAVAVIIIYSGICLVKETVDPLLGKAPDEELIKAIAAKIMSYQGVLGIHDLVVHEYGPQKIFASVHVEVDADEDVMKCHDLIDNIERNISGEFKIHFVIHMDPVVTKDEHLLSIKAEIENILSRIDASLHFHDLRYVPGYTHSNLIFDIVIPMGFEMDVNDLKQMVQENVWEIYPTYFTVITIDKNYNNIGE